MNCASNDATENSAFTKITFKASNAEKSSSKPDEQMIKTSSLLETLSEMDSSKDLRGGNFDMSTRSENEIEVAQAMLDMVNKIEKEFVDFGKTVDVMNNLVSRVDQILSQPSNDERKSTKRASQKSTGNGKSTSSPKPEMTSQLNKESAEQEPKRSNSNETSFTVAATSSQTSIGTATSSTLVTTTAAADTLTDSAQKVSTESTPDAASISTPTADPTAPGASVTGTAASKTYREKSTCQSKELETFLSKANRTIEKLNQKTAELKNKSKLEEMEVQKNLELSRANAIDPFELASGFKDNYSMFKSAVAGISSAADNESFLTSALRSFSALTDDSIGLVEPTEKVQRPAGTNTIKLFCSS